MPLVKYVGPHSGGVVIPYGLGEINAPAGVPVEVPDDLARGLLEQPSNWQPVEPPPPPTKPTTSPEEDDR